MPAHQLDILGRICIEVKDAGGLASPAAAALVVDGVIGYSLSGAPRGAAATLIKWAAAQSAPILALDVPPGVHASTGTVYRPAIHAAATLALELPKERLRDPEAARHVGELYLAAIGVPPELYARMKPPVAVGPIFAQDDVVRVLASPSCA